MAADLSPDPGRGAAGVGREPASRSRRGGVRDAVVLVVVLAVLALLVLRPWRDRGRSAAAGRSCEPQTGVLLGAGRAFPVSCRVERFGGGEMVRFADLQGGKPLVVNFWASWCLSCLKEMPGYQQVYAAGAGRFELVGVDVLGELQTIPGDTSTAGRTFARQLGVHYPLAFDEDWLLYRHFNSQPRLPATVFVRPNGVIAHLQFGPYAPEDLAAGIRTYLGIDVPVGDVRDRKGITRSHREPPCAQSANGQESVSRPERSGGRRREEDAYLEGKQPTSSRNDVAHRVRSEVEDAAAIGDAGRLECSVNSLPAP